MAVAHLVLRVAAAAGLAVDAAVHASLAGRYDLVSATVSQGDLFRIEAGAAALAALLVLLWRRPVGDLFGWLTAGAGIAALLVYRYDDLGAFGPFPNMYEPIWYTDKVRALAGQALALVALTPLLIAGFRRRPARAS
ncbi:hypothetical protein [Streptacidiphilus sp. EB129]|jgi:hypothetical protein|uniref:hypothetical protein n=1 Tax=Streptacidiphilus sp. EB129 TaxID=3156262 RepID=UPI0035123327